MNPLPFEWTFLDARETFSLPELSQVSGLSAAELAELMDYGALAPLAPEQQPKLFSAEWVIPLRKAGRLRHDFDLDLFSVAIVLGYVSRIDALEREVCALQARLPSDLARS
jgi:chaperone modulatory protein CbpM